MKHLITHALPIALMATIMAAPLALGGPVEKYQKNQHKRIEQGVSSGELTPKEAARLTREQARIEEEKKRMLSDGKLSPKERARLRGMQEQADRHIYGEKHD